MLTPSQRMDIKVNIYKIESIVNLPLMKSNPPSSEGFEDKIIVLLPYLSDLLAKMCSEECTKKKCVCGNRVNFTDDIEIDENIYDARSLITHFKNCLCSHPHTGRAVDEYDNRITGYLNGKVESYSGIDDLMIENPYSDDLMIHIGLQRLYYNRHIIRAYKEAKSYFKAII